MRAGWLLLALTASLAGLLSGEAGAAASVPSYDWGLTPPGLIPHFQHAEQAARLPGLGPFLAVKAWQAARAGQPLLDRAAAAAWALKHPTLAQHSHNTKEDEVLRSFQALERATLPKGDVGIYGGVGAYSPPLPKPAFYNDWGKAGSVGLFDMLAGANAFAGIHNGDFAPLLAFPASALERIDIQLYIAGYYVYRCLNSQNLPIMWRAQGDPVKLWAGLGQCWDSPASFAANSNPGAFVAFAARAAEVGIDLSALPYPAPVSGLWPGAAAYYKGLGIVP